MQIKKQLWKQLRNQTPCRGCGKDHPTKTCLLRSGRLRFSKTVPDDYHPRWQAEVS